MNKQGWTYKKLGEVAKSELGKTLNSSKDKGKLYPYLCAVNVLWDKIDTATLKEARFEEAELEKYSVKKGDLLICEGGDIGRSAIWNKEESLQYQNALHRVRFNGEVLPRFCLMYLKSLKEKGILDTRYGKGVTIKHLVKSSLLSIPIPIPPLAEQERIVAELDLLSSIIDKKKAQLKELDQLAQSIFYDMFGDPITNEKGWEVKKLKDNVQEMFLGPFGSALKVSCYVPESDAFAMVYEQKHAIQGTLEMENHFINREKFDSLSRFEVKPKDFIMSCRGTIGRIFQLPMNAPKGIIHPSLMKIRIKVEIYDYTFFVFLLQKVIAEQTTKGNCVQMAITAKELGNMDFIVPPLSLQQEFAKKVEAIERQKALVQQSIAETQTLFDSRMDHWFS